jgi:DNA-binding PadR family transcriptional regulator
MRRPSIQTQQVYQAFLDAPADETYGFEIVKATGLPSGSVYPILRRMEAAKLVNAREELIDPAAPHPRYRVYYRLTGEGRRVAHAATQNQRQALRSLSPGWAA